MAAVRARSSQKLLARSGHGDEALASRALAMLTTARRPRHGVVVSPTMSPISTMLGRPRRFALVA
jgi:hypothetical protein